MKIAIIGFTKIVYMPYLRLYLEQINLEYNEVHLIYWARDDRNDLSIPDGIVGHCFDIPMEDTIELRRKLPIIYRYGVYAKKVIKGIKPDFIIVLHSTTAFSIKSILLHKYREKYIFDYRDLTYEKKIAFYGSTVKRIAEHSVATFTSSDGFREVLPNIGKVYTSHNIMPDAERLYNQFRGRKWNRQVPIRVAFWGLLRHYELNRLIVDKLCSDSRFEVHYYGRAQGKMLQLMRESEKKYKFFFFHGEYKPDDRLKFAEETDIILNIYDKVGTMLYAMSNKYYDGIVFCIPQLCMEGSFMGKQCEKTGVGFACNPYRDSFTNDVIKYYEELNEQAFVTACQTERERIMKQVIKDNEIIRGVLSDEG